jgi:hypothetical protein
MNYNVCLVQPNGYEHSGAFTELAELVCYGLQDLGFDCEVTVNNFESSARNILIGFHLIDQSHISQIPPNSILLNTEQIAGAESDWRANIMAFVSQFEVWDYSASNLSYLNSHGIHHAKRLTIGYHDKLKRIQPAADQDIDVLFYGSTNRRRNHILKQLSDAGLNVVIRFGEYGASRDALIARSKVILNHHYYDSKIFEIVRVFYLMSNAKAVVCEVGKDTQMDERYRAGIDAADYDELTAHCINLVKDAELRHQLEQQALATIRQHPQHELMRSLLD